MAEKIPIPRNPITLYAQSLDAYVNNLQCTINIKTMEQITLMRSVPLCILSDIYMKMSTYEKLHRILFEELIQLDRLKHLLKFSPARQQSFRYFSALMVTDLAMEIAVQFRRSTLENFNYQPNNETEEPEYLKHIDSGLCIGSFLTEAGWLNESISILSEVLDVLNLLAKEYRTNIIKLDCLQRLLHAQAGYCCFKDAQRTILQANQIIESVGIDKIPKNLLANWYIKVSALHFAKSEYDLSYTWCTKALKLLDHKTPHKITVDVLRQASKSCVLKRQFKKANMLVLQAVKIAKSTFGKHHQKYADALLDHGFFLLNVDSILLSVNVYREALEIKRDVFGNHNLHVAIALEDLSYALYVCEYSSGRFKKAQDSVEQAIKIFQNIVSPDHLMLASAKRVKALILEEIALDEILFDNIENNPLLLQAEELHQSALQLSLEAFGEYNVQTAKHYGNLGRLYQSKTQYWEAEKMHKKAIRIKTDILGPHDYEVGLSIGHLASLYNYHMQKHRQAEVLYLHSVSISLTLFGANYSGLEYDYRGLCHVYESLGDYDKHSEYRQILETWKILQDERDEGNLVCYDAHLEDSSVEDVTKKFFELCIEQK